MSSNPPKGKLDITEIIAKFPSLIVIFQTISDKVQQAGVDGKMTGEELGGIIAAAAVPLGKLVDEVIVDLQD